MIRDTALERDNKKKGTRISLFFHLALLILAFFIGCPHEKAIENQYAIAVNFEEVEFRPSSNSNTAQAESGEARPTADPVEDLENKPAEQIEVKQPEVKLPEPTPTPPNPTDPILSETTMEESEVEAVEDDIEIEEPELEPIPPAEPEGDPEPEVVEIEEPEPEPKKETIKDKILKFPDIFKTGGSKKNPRNPDGPPSRSDGNEGGTGEGKTGDGPGRDKTGDDGDSGQGTGGAGVGEYDDSGDGVFGRKVIWRNVKEIPMTQTGKVAFKVCINRAGIVTHVELLEMETTITDRSLLKKTAEAASGYKFEPDYSAPREQCGKLKITLDINAFKISDG